MDQFYIECLLHLMPSQGKMPSLPISHMSFNTVVCSNVNIFLSEISIHALIFYLVTSDSLAYPLVVQCLDSIFILNNDLSIIILFQLPG